MNSNSSLAKYAPRAGDWSEESPWRVVSHSEGLAYLGTAFMATNPVQLSHVRIRVNLGLSDSIALTNSVKRFFKALKSYEFCTHLDLQHCQLTDHACRSHVGPMLQVNKSLVDVDFGYNAFTDAGAGILFASLVSTNIGTLKFAGNPITHDCIESLSKTMVAKDYSVVDFANTDIGAAGLKNLLPGLITSNRVEKLNLENCKIGNEGCLELAKAFNDGHLTTLQSLLLAENHIGRESVGSLVKHFVDDSPAQVKALDLSKNYIGDEGFEQIRDVMKRGIQIEHLKCNKIGLTMPKFTQFCEDMLARYDQEFSINMPRLRKLEVGSNGLGIDFQPMLRMVEHKNCQIECLVYDGNEVTNYGAKLLKVWMKEVFSKCRLAVDDRPDSEMSAENAAIRNTQREMRRAFQKLTLKSNLITGDGCEHLAQLVNLSNHPKFVELDLRKNKIGVSGAIWFKKAFRTLQCTERNFATNGHSFRFHIMPEDVTIEGLNHLAIGIREHPDTLREYLQSIRENKDFEKFHNYQRTEEMQQKWRYVNYINDDTEHKRRVHNGDEAVEVIPGANAFAQRLDVETDVKISMNDLASQLAQGRADVVDNTLRHHLGTVASRFTEFDTPSLTSANLHKPGMKYGVHLVGETDEKDNTLGVIEAATYSSWGIEETDRGVLKWCPVVYDAVRDGWGCVLANTLYRYSLLLRFQYEAESDEYVQDLYLHRYLNGTTNSFMRKMLNLKRKELIARMVADDIREFWDGLMYQTSKASEGMTMFEFVLKYADSPVIDCLRQFLNVFPAQAYARSKTTNAVFLQQEIAHSGLTYRDLCLQSKDKFVRRYAQAKKLVFFRFLEIEPVYVSKWIKISKVEDLLLTEEYADEDRFFYMRRIAGSSAAKDENLAKNELEAHKSFAFHDLSYLSGGEQVSMDKVENIILKNVNATLDADFIPQISQLFHRKQMLSDDELMPTFTGIYKTNLREVLDNESLAGGRDLSRAQIMLKMIAYSLHHFNNRDWTASYPPEALSSFATKGRIHGNVKPRNIILRSGDELPDLDSAVGYRPGRWVLSDFTRSTAHGDEYFAPADSAYNPPEVAKRLMVLREERHLKKRLEANEKMDVWQFGCILFEVLSGTTLFKMEGNTDRIVDDKERGELINWLSLDDERADLILNQLKATRANSYSYKSSHMSMSLNNWGSYDDETIENIIESGKQLVRWCLQGRPEDRPGFDAILSHPFLREVDVGKTREEKVVDEWANIRKEAWDNEEFLQSQPHVHLVNTNFEEAGLVKKSFEEALSRSGCRLTTDSMPADSPEQYEKELKSNVSSARVVVCLLTSDAFYKPGVVKQLLIAEGNRERAVKVHSRILFLDISSGVDLSKNGKKWDKKDYAANYVKSDEFQYLVQALATENPSVPNVSIKTVDYQEKFDAWKAYLSNDFRAMISSYIQESVKYHPRKSLKVPMLDRILADGQLVPTHHYSKISIPSLSSKNFKDADDILNKKLQDRKKKFLDLYFLPANKTKRGAIRVYVLCRNAGDTATTSAVSEIARALEAPSDVNQVKNSVDRHKDASNPRNRLFNKVKTSFNLKKASHLKVGGRSTGIQKAKDAVLNVTREDGALLIVILVNHGVCERYSKFLHEAVEKRYGNGLSVVLVEDNGFVLDEALKEEIDEFVPEVLKSKFLNKDSYLQYFKPKKDPWQHEAAMKELVKQSAYVVEHPSPREAF